MPQNTLYIKDTSKESVFINYDRSLSYVNIFKFTYTKCKPITYKCFKYDLDLYTKYFHTLNSEDFFNNYCYDFQTYEYKISAIHRPNSKHEELKKKYSVSLCGNLGINEHANTTADIFLVKVLNIRPYKMILNKYIKQNNLSDKSKDYIGTYIENRMKVNEICNL